MYPAISDRTAQKRPPTFEQSQAYRLLQNVQAARTSEIRKSQGKTDKHTNGTSAGSNNPWWKEFKST